MNTTTRSIRNSLKIEKLNNKFSNLDVNHEGLYKLNEYLFNNDNYMNLLNEFKKFSDDEILNMINHCLKPFMLFTGIIFNYLNINITNEELLQVLNIINEKINEI